MADDRILEILTIQDDRERRIQLLILRLPEKAQSMVHWLRRPQAKWVRMPAGIALICGGCLAILPVFGLWMLPLGIMLLAEDVSFLRNLTNKALAWVERRKPHWMGLHAPATSL
ncbi:hypothetical protein HK15_09180 [Acetobacter orientalis]|uniref:Uncharacterized protein n=1 Tax=Acetobacter orientalis TaxID=146474 RepID=A0A252BAD1_9PROT|nr:hypothetical protein [Acetobacter orientalis]OUJ01160.1 hypothetical protein HK15_09180 [Acetobacter orientalis]